MKHVELDAHYLYQLVQEKVVTLVYYSTKALIVNIFMNLFSYVKFVKLHSILGIHATIIIEVSPKDLISPLKSLDHYVDGGMMELKDV